MGTIRESGTDREKALLEYCESLEVLIRELSRVFSPLLPVGRAWEISDAMKRHALRMENL